MFTIGVLKRYLEIMAVAEPDREQILTRAQDLAEEDDEVLMGGSVIDQIFDGFPSLRSGLTYEMFQRIRKEKPDLLDPLRERSRERGMELLEDPGPAQPGMLIVVPEANGGSESFGIEDRP